MFVDNEGISVCWGWRRQGPVPRLWGNKALQWCLFPSSHLSRISKPTLWWETPHCVLIYIACCISSSLASYLVHTQISDCFWLWAILSRISTYFGWWNDTCFSAVGGLLQTRFASGLLSQLPDSPNPPTAVQWSTKLTVQPPLSFLLPSHAPEPPIKTVGMRRLGGPIPIKESVTQGKVSPYVLYRFHLWVSCQHQ